jgi:hypothetical protein
MPDDLHRTDIVTWSRRQAEALRRHVAGERVNDLDWAHVIKEIEDLGASEIAQVGSSLTQAMIHALKVARWPESPSRAHWQAEALTFLEQAQDRYRSSMAAKLKVRDRFKRARKTVLAMTYDGSAEPLPDDIALNLRQLMNRNADFRALIDAIGRGTAVPQQDT